MPILVYDCPHCGASKMTFTSHGSHRDQQGIWNALFLCHNCEKGIVARLSGARGQDFNGCRGNPLQNGYRLLAVHPSPTRLEAPPHVPEKLRDEYVEGLRVLRGKNFKSAGMMFRRVLEMATKSLSSDEKEKTLYERIAHLENTGKITAGLRGLADCIRDDGNEATHEEEYDERKTGQLQEFTRLFLIYTFSLPRFVELAQQGEATESEE